MKVFYLYYHLFFINFLAKFYIIFIIFLIYFIFFHYISYLFNNFSLYFLFYNFFFIIFLTFTYFSLISYLFYFTLSTLTYQFFFFFLCQMTGCAASDGVNESTIGISWLHFVALQALPAFRRRNAGIARSLKRLIWSRLKSSSLEWMARGREELFFTCSSVQCFVKHMMVCIFRSHCSEMSASFMNYSSVF